jgi:hypothetical protein
VLHQKDSIAENSFLSVPLGMAAEVEDAPACGEQTARQQCLFRTCRVVVTLDSRCAFDAQRSRRIPGRATNSCSSRDHEAAQNSISVP